MKIPSAGSFDGNLGALRHEASPPDNLQAQETVARLLDEGSDSKKDPTEVKKAFNDFVGQTFFGQMLASMRATQQETPYFNGGRAEKIFQGQLDQVLTEELSESSASKIADPMFELFQLHRR